MGQPHISHILNNTVLYIKYFVKRVNLMLGVLITIKGGGGGRKGGRKEMGHNRTLYYIAGNH